MTSAYFHDNKPIQQLPDIDCVIIGVNCEATIKRCLDSVKASNYPEQLLHIYYVDGGSSDNSLNIAESVAGVSTVALYDTHPTPGRGRNSGWKQGRSDFVQFLDGDTILDQNWLQRAIDAFTPELGAITGNRKEIHPDSSVYNWLADLEWNLKTGLVDCFGGDVMVRRKVLEETQGYDELMVAGEDPELSRRVIDEGWQILHLNIPMTGHDLAMFTLGQYLKRAYRSGYGFAALVNKHKNSESGFWHEEIRRIVIRGGGSLSCGALACLSLLFNFSTLSSVLFSTTLTALAIFLLFFPRFFRVRYFSQQKAILIDQAKIYSMHCSLVVVPQLFGLLRYYLGLLFKRPLLNKSKTLSTATLSP